MRSRSIFSGVFSVVRPRRWERRMPWVSIVIPSAIPNALARTTLAVLRATPGRASSSAMV